MYKIVKFIMLFIMSFPTGSLEHSPSDSFRRKSLLAEAGRAASVCDVQLKEDLAEAMKEDHGTFSLDLLYTEINGFLGAG